MGQVLFLFSFATDLWWPKRFSRVCPYILEQMMQYMRLVATFTGEGISEVEGLMCNARMDDVVGK